MTDHIAIEEQAASWLMRRAHDDWSDAEQDRLTDWLQLSAAHKAAFWRLEYGYGQLDRMSALGPAFDSEQSVAASDPSARFWSPRWAPSVRAFQRMLVAASIIAILAVGLSQVNQPPLPPQITAHATKFGQMGDLKLADGSNIELNTDTTVRILQSATERMLSLERGEAFLQIAHDAHRPFVVHAGPNVLTVLGTKFAVHREANNLTVSVLEGSVRVGPAGHSTGSVTMTSGQIAQIEGGSVRVTSGNLEKISNDLAWRDQKLVFDDVTLAEAVAQFNRYNRHRLIVQGDDMAAIRISGTFQVGNAEGFARLLERAYGLRTIASAGEIKITSR